MGRRAHRKISAMYVNLQSHRLVHTFKYENQQILPTDLNETNRKFAEITPHKRVPILSKRITRR
uniref:Putative ovule protein n=1 Tax=Solanum chacoense TaxID=4108 RepID=A0A0V0GTB3_SOLCH